MSIAKKFITANDIPSLVEQLNNIFNVIYSYLDTPIVFTKDGGIAVPYKNISGRDLKRGEVVALGTTNSSVVVAAASAINGIGVVYENTKDGEEGLVVVGQKAYVLIKDGTSATAGNWIIISDVAGRADATASLPTGGSLQAHDQHFGEIGHCEETKASGIDVLVLSTLHFN